MKNAQEGGFSSRKVPNAPLGSITVENSYGKMDFLNGQKRLREFPENPSFMKIENSRHVWMIFWKTDVSRDKFIMDGLRIIKEILQK